jgi:predicted O-methyltransferase YrrM
MSSFDFEAVSRVFWEIHEATNKRFITGCGSYLFDGGTYRYDVNTAPKQQLLARVASEVESVLEIGTYLGHSLLVMLAGNPKLRVTTVDVDATFAAPAVAVIKRHFPEAKIDFVHGSSLSVLPDLTDSYDLFHVDGTHEPPQVRKEWQALLPRRSSDLVRVVFDDVDTIWSVVEEIKRSVLVVEEAVPACRWRNAYYAVQIKS